MPCPSCCPCFPSVQLEPRTTARTPRRAGVWRLPHFPLRHRCYLMRGAENQLQSTLRGLDPRTVGGRHDSGARGWARKQSECEVVAECRVAPFCNHKEGTWPVFFFHLLVLDLVLHVLPRAPMRIHDSERIAPRTRRQVGRSHHAGRRTAHSQAEQPAATATKSAQVAKPLVPGPAAARQGRGAGAVQLLALEGGANTRQRLGLRPKARCALPFMLPVSLSCGLLGP